MTTIHKTHAEMFNQMMESTTVEEMALFETQVAPPAPLRPALSLTPEVRHQPLASRHCCALTILSLSLSTEQSCMAFGITEKAVQGSVW